eukprot:scaffold28241_cov35-Tisochrysis_lutea.AAC.1
MSASKLSSFALFILGIAVAAATSQQTSSLLRALRKPLSTLAVVVRLTPTECVVSDQHLIEASERLRVAGVDAIILQGGTHALKLVHDEQRGAASEFPGPCPVLFQPLPVPSGADLYKLMENVELLVLPQEVLRSLDRHSRDAGFTMRSHASCVAIVSTMAQFTEAAFGVDDKLPLVFTTESVWTQIMAEGATPESRSLMARYGGDADAQSASKECNVEPSKWFIVPEFGSERAVDVGARARTWRSAGCAGVLIDYDLTDCPYSQEDLIKQLLSKRSSSFGNIATRQGVGIGASAISDQYWLNKNIKEAKSMIAKSRAASGNPVDSSVV